MTSAGGAVVDPTVSRAKFEREVDTVRRRQAEYHVRGIWLIEATFPVVFVVMASPQLRPPPVVFGALFDFADYDLRPASVRLVNPFTREPYKAGELPTHLKRRAPMTPEIAAQALAQGQDPAQVMVQQPMMQFNTPDDIPFLCLPGVREYHDHPAHTGDSWLLRRGTTEGSLVFFLEQLHKYGIAPLAGYQMPTIVLPHLGMANGELPE